MQLYRNVALRWLSGAVVALCLHTAGTVFAEDGPPHECAAGIKPSAPVPGAPPGVLAWSDHYVPAAALARCAGWGEWRPAVAVALSGNFRIDGGRDALLARIGAISETTGIKYWSLYSNGWKTLVTAAAALESADTAARRADFTPDELKTGEPRYFVQYDNRSTGGVIYRMQVTTLDEDRIAVTVENVSDVGFLFVSAFHPGDLRSVHMLQRVAPDRWEYFGLFGAHEGEFGLLGRHAATNRVVAYYRYLAGIPTDRDPPLAAE